jgi:hypothetical protein
MTTKTIAAYMRELGLPVLAQITLINKFERLAERAFADGVAFALARPDVATEIYYAKGTEKMAIVQKYWSTESLEKA